MKLLLLFLVGLGYGTVFGQRNIPEYEIEDKRLLQLLTKLADTVNRAHKGKWIMEIHFTKANTRFDYAVSVQTDSTISFDLSKEPSVNIDLAFYVIPNPFIGFVPTAFTVINDVPILIYTGIEPLMKHSQSSTDPPAMKRLIRRFKNRTENLFTMYYGWFVEMKNDTVRIQFIPQFPLIPQ